MLYVCETSNGTAKVSLDCEWEPTGVESNKFWWEIRTLADGAAPEWGTTQTNSFEADPATNLTWDVSNATGATTNREFLIRAWFDCNGDGDYQSTEPHRIVHVTIIKVEFEEDSTQSYGFDNHTDANVPWKSVEKGKTDKAKAKTTPSASANQVYFKSVDTAKVTVSPAQASTSPEPLTFTGVAKGESEIQGNVGSTSGSTAGKMKAACYERKTKTIAVTLVHEAASGTLDSGYTSTDISDADITSMLEKVYGQSVQEFTLTRRPAQTVDFDDNHDGKVDVDSWMSGEMTKIRDACQSSHDFNIFFVDKPSDGSSGFMSFNQKYGFIHADNGNSRTIAHELGHGQGLSHTPSDAINIMYNYTSTTKWRLRKSQWDSLNP
jgi:hypothetical protein